MWKGQRLCRDCATRQSREERSRADEEERAQKRDRRADELRRLEAIGDPMGRLAASVAWILSRTSSAAWTDHTTQTISDFQRLTSGSLPPDAAPTFEPRAGWSFSRDDGRWPWDSAELGRWFAAHADWDFPPNVRLRRSSTATDRAIYLHTTTAWNGNEGYGARSWTYRLSVLEDGRVGSLELGGPSPYRYAFSIYRLPGVDKPWRDKWEESELSPQALAEMAMVLGLDVPGEVKRPAGRPPQE